MAKGIVKKTPTATTRKHPGSIKVTSVDTPADEGRVGTLVDFDDPGFNVFENDYVEIQFLTPTACKATKKYYAKGIVRELPSTSTPNGKLMVTVFAPNELGIHKNSDLSYNNYDAMPLRVNDYVDFINMNASSCDAIRKIENCGELIMKPEGQSGGMLKVWSIGNPNNGVAVGQNLTFKMPSQASSPFELRDMIEFQFKSDGTAEYVQVIHPFL